MKAASIRKPPLDPILFSFASPDAVKDALASFIIKAQREAIAKKGRFTIALSGGSLPKMLAGLLDSKDVKWEQWYVPSEPSILVLLKFREQASLLRR
jgi:6-phosphogluconolactonase